MNQVIPKATLYIIISENIRSYGYKRIEARNVHHETIEHAGYQKAVRVEFIPKGKRKPREIIDIDNPTLVILEGWGHPEIRDSRQFLDNKDGIVSYIYRHDWISEEWNNEFNEFLRRYLEESSSVVVLADYRGHNTLESKLEVLPSSQEPLYAVVNEDKRYNQERLGALPLPEEVLNTDTFREGATSQLLVNAYERSPVARQKCIAHYGTSCSICGFDFSEIYGRVGDGLIHVHHLTPLSDIGQEYEVDPIRDLRPVCPNCHAVIHRRNPPYSIREVKDFLRQTRSSSS